MKRIYFFIFTTVSLSGAFACDLCNCYLTITPNDHKNAIGFRYRFSSYEGAGDHSMMMAKILHGGSEVKEEYRTYEMWLRYYPVPKIQMEFVIPFRYNRSIEEGMPDHTLNGMGDLIVLTHYELIRTFPMGPDAFKQRLYVGGGIKIPTGEYDKKTGGEFDPHLQTGTGSLDFMMSALYLVKYRQTGAKASVNYSMNRKNRNDFTFANRLNLSSAVFYQLTIGDFIWMPSLGVYFEQAKKDKQNNIALENTGGTMWLGAAGTDLYYKSYALNFSYQTPLKQTIGAEQAKNQGRFIIGMTYSFASKNEMF